MTEAQKNKLITKVTTLRSVIDDVLSELEADKAPAPKQRQNKKQQRVMNYDLMYRKTKKRA